MHRWKWLVAGVLGVLLVGAMGMTLHASTDPKSKSGPPDTAVTLSVTGARTGVIASDKSPIIVMAYSHNVNSPRDAATGMASGKRMHKPFVITKEIDKSSPQLMQALVTNEVLKTATLRMPVGQGSYTITLTDAAISDISQSASDQGGSPTEAVSFVYQKITWTYQDASSKTMATDDWATPR